MKAATNQFKACIDQVTLEVCTMNHNGDYVTNAL